VKLTGRTILTVLASIAVFAAVYFGGTYAYDHVFHRSHATGDPGVRLARDLERDPSFKVLRETFPDEFAELKSVVLARAKAGGGEAEVSAAGFAYMRNLAIRHAPDVAAAPAPLLGDYAAAQAGLVRALRDENPQLCADFAFRALPAGLKASPKVEKAGMANLEAQLRAARAGRDNPVARRAADRSDYDEITRVMARNGARSDLVRSLSTGSATSLPVEEQCELGVALYDAVRKAPPDLSARVTATMMTAAAQQLRRG
jgi:hypothetical protein